jgi:hypothetical protein
LVLKCILDTFAIVLNLLAKLSIQGLLCLSRRSPFETKKK